MLRLTSLLAVLLTGLFPFAAAADDPSWEEIVAEAEGQTVYWNAWGGDETINAYIAWAGDRLAEDYGITLQHVKLSDTSQAVTQVLAEKSVGRDSGGSVDAIWLNGENFAAMKEAGLLTEPFTQLLPNFRYVDTEGKPTTLVDFTVPTEGRESPWGMAQLVFQYDSDIVAEPPPTMAALLAYAEANPGRVTYPAPPDFLGSTFLKQALISLVDDPSVLAAPVKEADFAATTAPLWDYLDALTPHLWRSGRAFPVSGVAMRQLLGDGEIDISFSFNPNDAAQAVENGLIPPSVRSYTLDGGTIGNTHFVTIPYNASNKAGALVLANFLLSPEAQARKANPEIWGDPTVLDIEALPPEDRALFEALPSHPASLPAEDMGKTLLEPHPSWMTRLEEEWSRRYQS